ncbi:bifunctional enoyl-CoA hydratase/phosphate acetyltransferase [Paracoccus sp. S-4012]|uniref:bifunctional enoyl-CoA hydratase/phosphate acetyltransferase n=1 Tax=Paracoccus sp. S-4012 TaxID=2665648 RepID=UPI0012AF6651|nr:bifunctional enoyl-CoA hydratase/phosphate acetyltransferase [Paracoccus sp. S-4012]MRX49476.1 bifunctional enoyl-CoA hydratase/phosphate acetyltransferase [Paracoccus sp. S-4012]
MPETEASPMGEIAVLQNKTFDEISLGDTASVERTLSAADIRVIAVLTGFADRDSVDADSAAVKHLDGMIAHGMWGSALIAMVLGTRLPGPGATYLGESLAFLGAIRPGDTITTRVEIVERDAASRRVRADCRCTNQQGDVVLEGWVDLIAPADRVTWARASLPEIKLTVANHGTARLLEHVRSMGAVRAAIVHPCDAISLSSVFDARDAGLIDPVLVAPRARLEAFADEAGLDLDGLRVEDVQHSHAAAERAVELAAAGEVEVLVKGSLHTDELMGAVIAARGGLRTKRRVTHCFVMQTSAYPRPFIITDAAVNIAPTLSEKADIVRNAIDLAHVLGIQTPRVAILAAVETVSPTMPATLDAAALCKMADRGQITGALLDGPLAFDNAVSPAAAHIKGIVSPVAGQADILVVPDLESGNMLAKQLEYLGGADTAGIALGAKVPIVLTSRADARDTRLASCAIALMLAHHYRVSPP